MKSNDRIAGVAAVPLMMRMLMLMMLIRMTILMTME